jgi:hypothetical protein
MASFGKRGRVALFLSYFFLFFKKEIKKRNKKMNQGKSVQIYIYFFKNWKK